MFYMRNATEMLVLQVFYLFTIYLNVCLPIYYFLCIYLIICLFAVSNSGCGPIPEVMCSKVQVWVDGIMGLNRAASVIIHLLCLLCVV